MEVDCSKKKLPGKVINQGVKEIIIIIIIFFKELGVKMIFYTLVFTSGYQEFDRKYASPT